MTGRTSLYGPLKATIIGAGLMALLGAAASADVIGQQDYTNFCASCHGATGGGDGPLAELMTIAPPPLTGLSAANEGVFPMDDIIRTIDGRNEIRAHGADMPVWGGTFKSVLAGEVSNEAADLAVRGRILSLAYYLESIQQ